MTDGLVSVIMPSWNTGRFIAESIKSVINQTYKNWELIIVDDCSTDNTDEVVASFDEKRIRYFKNEKNSGAALTRNKAMREAQGEWIAFLDSDDIWHPEKLEKQINFMNKNGYVFSYTEYEKIDEYDKPLNVYVTGPTKVNKRKMYNYDYIGQLTMMYSTKYFGVIQIKDIKKNNDYAIRLQLYKKDNTCCYLLKENLAKYRVRKKSVSHDKLSKKLKSHYDLFHFCDENIAPVALLYAGLNMFFGLLKKINYEKNVIC
jgi:glycosyltransferase involved in cell wall biosynthesis